MKKFGFLIFLTALFSGLMLAPGCDLKNSKSVQGSGTSKSETRNVSNFTKIEVNGAVDLEITVQKDFSVEITSDDYLIDSVKTEVNSSTLKISSAVNSSSKNKTFIKISMPDLEKLDVTGASTAKITGVKTDSFELISSGASAITIDGQVKDFKVQANGASSINAGNLKSVSVSAEANGVSSISVFALDELKAEANGASTINYGGNPKNVKQNSSGASSINKQYL